jgi:EmrB/QacA subfamily drug resistance transporter
MITLDVTVVNVALPKIQDGLHFSATALSWVLTAYTLSYGGFLLLGGRAGDTFGRRRMLIVGVVLFTVASLVGGLATTSGELLAARAVQGVGSALAAPGALALIATTFGDGAERNKALGVFSSVVGGGFVVGLILGGVLATASWRWVMLINVPIGVTVAALAPRLLDETERRPGRLDVPGALVATAGITSLVYAFVRAASEGWRDGVTIAALIAAAVLLPAFVLYQSRVRSPLLPLRLLADRTRVGAYLTMLLLPATMFGAFFFITQYVQHVLGYGSLRAGLAFLPMGVPFFITGRLSPRLIPRFGPKLVTLGGVALVVVAAAWLSRLSGDDGYLAVAGPMVLLGVGVGTAFMPLNLLILSGVPRTDTGSAAGLLQTFQQIGGSLGLAVLVTVFAAAGGVSAESAGKNPARGTGAGAALARAHEATGHAIGRAFGVSLIFSLCALLVATVVLRAPRRATPPSSPSSPSPAAEV